MTKAPFAVILFRLTPYLESELRQRFEIVKLYELPPAEAKQWLAANAKNVTAIVTNGKEGCNGDVIAALPELKIVAIYGVGFDAVDVDAARTRNIVVTNTPGVLTNDVADLAVGLVISLLRRIPDADRHIRDGHWSHTDFPLTNSVTGKKFGIFGLGRIGTAIANRLSVFGTVSYTSNTSKPVPWTFYQDVVSLARASDVLIVACAASERTRAMVNHDVLAALGPDGFIVNIARGSIVDENALIEALGSGRLAGAALDVFQNEPDVRAELKASDRVVLTPHVGSATTETRRAMADAVLASLDAFLARMPIPNKVC